MKRNPEREAALDRLLLDYRDRCLMIYRNSCPPSQRASSYELARRDAIDRIYAADRKPVRKVVAP